MTTLPHPDQIVRFRRARFTVLTDRMLRLEWAEDGRHEDLLTLTVSNRRTDPVPFTVTREGDTLKLETGALTLRYTDDGKPFSRKNLGIRFGLDGKPVAWFPGRKDAQNLKGTAQTLDEAMGNRKKRWIPAQEADPALPVLERRAQGTLVFQGEWVESLVLCDGLISRSGWAVVDDSTSVVLDPALCDWQPWVREREPGARCDLYFLGYGHAFKDALRDAAAVFGRQPLPPRYALGYWYSRYWAYTDKELKQVVEDFDAMNLPLDVLVIDMDWHKGGWTGYSWDPAFFPDPEGLLNWLKRRDVKITLNLHPADGVFDYEDDFPAMLRAMGLKRSDLPPLDPPFHAMYARLGLDPEQARRIPLDVTDPNYMRAYFTCLHHPKEKAGVDFWWMDWQQGRTGSKLPHLAPLPWINELHWQDQARNRPQKRPLNFSRFGGLGAGRMPVGFSGDTIISWESLAYQPYFTATAANVLFGYWSHDIGGHMSGELTPELYTRWLQFGMYSPILRTHTTKSMESERRIFHYPDPCRGMMGRTLRRRYELVPYLYRELRKGVDHGLSLVRPMYYEWPGEPEAFQCPGQYLFGDDMIVAPVVTPVTPGSQLAPVTVWLPPGEWIDTAKGTLVPGGGWYTGHYTLEEVPVFVRPGTVIPEQTFTRRLGEGSFPEVVFRLYPGPSGEGGLYEDDGGSMDWARGGSAELRLSHRTEGTVRTLTLAPARGDFKGFKTRRRVRIILENVAPPDAVEGAQWRYDGDAVAVHLDLGVVDLNQEHQITLVETEASVQAIAQGLKGVMTRMEQIRILVCQGSPALPIHRDDRLAVHIAQTGNRISLRPASFRSEIERMHDDLARLPRALGEMIEAYACNTSEGNSRYAKIKALQQAAALLERME